MIADSLARLWRRACRHAAASGGEGAATAATGTTAAAATAAALAGQQAQSAPRGAPSATTTVWPAAALAAFDVCLQPLSVYAPGLEASGGGGGGGGGGGAGSAAASAASAAVATSSPSSHGGWRYYADRPNKFGWIATAVGARISFDLRFGAAPRFCLTYLRSYERVGRVELALPTVGFRTVVDALWSDRASQSDVLWFGTTQGHDMTISYNTMYVDVPPNSTQTLEATLLATPERSGGDKFKIIQLVSC